MKTAVVCGAGGFIGNHLVNRLKSEGIWVRGVDLSYPQFSETCADEFVIADLRDYQAVQHAFDRSFDEVYQLAADMGGAGYIFTGEHDADIMHNSAQINLNVLRVMLKMDISKVFYSSSACVYPKHNQLDAKNPQCNESSAYPADPDSDYGWEKLFSERLYQSYARNYGFDISIARYHNIFGPSGAWCGGKEKAPAALCRKIAEAEDGSTIEIWGNGQQTRSFLYIDECIEGTMRLMRSEFDGPVNIGSDEMVTIDELANIIIDVSQKRLGLTYVDGPVGVNGRNSDNQLIRRQLGWAPTQSLQQGLIETYHWIASEVGLK